MADDDAPFCDAYGALLVGPLADAATDATEPVVLAGAVAVTEDLLADLSASVPDELRDAVASLDRDYDGDLRRAGDLRL